MPRLADLCPGEANTEARDAFIIADAARTIGFDDDLAGEAPAPPTGCAARSPGSTPPWNGSWASGSSTRPS
jgi:hypothetical protein